MKALLLSIILFSTYFAISQTTSIPDNNFETFLENNGMGNGIPGDNLVTTSNISGVTSLIVWGWNIADLTGIEDFAALQTLYSFDNPLTSLNVTQNSALSELRCYNNGLTSLDVTQNPALSLLFCFDNQISSLDVSQNPALNELRCYNNIITSLDISQNNNLTLLHCYSNPLSTLTTGSHPLLNDFRCYSSQLSSIDVTQCPSLATLFCYNSNFTSLDVTQNSALDLLFCYNNDLTSLDVSQNSALTDLRCFINQLTSLDVTQNPLLETLLCSNNQLECLNANNGQNIYLDCSSNQLSCISVISPPWAVANDTFDSGVSFQFQCQTLIDNDVIQNGTVLTAVQNGATYQWLDCNLTDGVLNGETNQTFNALTTGYYAVEITYSDCGGIQVDTSSCHLVDFTGIEELVNGTVELVKITDLIGRETPYKPNTVLIYIYSDGTTEKVFKAE